MVCCSWTTLLIANAVFGLLALEWSWMKLKTIINVNEERDSKFPAFRRYDA
jgi:hypothetical protein